MTDREILMQLLEEFRQIKDAFLQLPEWYPLTEIARDKGMTRQTLRAKVLNGDFEPEVDFKYEGHKIFIARSAVPRIRRKRQ
jgi:predicted transcriptional regulator